MSLNNMVSMLNDILQQEYAHATSYCKASHLGLRYLQSLCHTCVEPCQHWWLSQGLYISVSVVQPQYVFFAQID